MTITEFTLARIAEDDEQARSRWRVPDGRMPPTLTRTTLNPGVMFIMVNGEQRAITDEEYRQEYLEPAPDKRLLAECEAKRRRVEWAMANLDENAVNGDWSERGMDATVTSDIAEWLLKIEALPYATHPDFDETWRP